MIPASELVFGSEGNINLCRSLGPAFLLENHMDTITLSQSGMQIALRSRLGQNPRLGDRSQYLGASEVGSCLRRVVSSKLYPEPFDQASMGRMLAGKAMENEVVQLIRIALNGRLRNTGRVQLELRHATLPFHAHPDGRIIGGLDGDGVLEVKTASAALFKKYQSDGLPQNYHDQVQVQMGLSGLLWAMVVLVSRENLAEIAVFTIPFEPEHYSLLERRAKLAVAALRDKTFLNQLAGEPDRGFCHTCPYSAQCSSYQTRREAGARGEIPEVTRLQLECQLEEMASLEATLSPLQERVSELRDQVKSALLSTGATKVLLENGLVQVVESSRTCLESKALQREAPDVYARFSKTTTCFNLRVTYQGAGRCLTIAS
jgi:CRISPR-associated exonuclease Cas4